MGRRTREQEIDEAAVEVEEPSKAAAGVTAVSVALKRAVSQMGVLRSGRTLTRLNQVDGFDCQGCAWPDPAPGHRHPAEFCENGVKAVADEATRDLLGREFFAAHPVSELADHTDYWLNRQGRITEPFVLRAGASHYEPIDWDEAFAMMARHLRGIAPDEAIFYTSGKTSNEAAYLYQLFARAYGTNNLPC
jgi:formate dehydrogenase major subunit